MVFLHYNKSMQSTLLVTGFEPFDGRAANQSQRLLNTLKKSGFRTLLLPVLFKDSFLKLEIEMTETPASVILCLGEANEAIPRLEHFGLNMMHARIPDNHGYIPELIKIQPHGKITRTTRVNLQDLADYLHEKGVSYRHSFHAGTYVCNDLYYRTLSAYPHQQVLFVHISHDEKDFDQSLQTVQAILDYFSQLSYQSR